MECPLCCLPRRARGAAVSVEDTIVKMNEDKTPLPAFAEFLWVSKPQSGRSRARQLAQLAIGTIGREVAEYPKVKVSTVYGGGTFYVGVVYAGRRTRREAAKERG